MNSYISRKEALENGLEFLASKESVEQYVNDPVKKKVIDAKIGRAHV